MTAATTVYDANGVSPIRETPNGEVNPLAEFLDRYEHDWVLLVEEVFGFDPDEFQREIIAAVCRGERRISIRSGHGVGKTTTLALCICCQILTRFPQKTICTAPTSAQLFEALYAETVAWMNKLPDDLKALFVIKSESIELAEAPKESFVSFRTSRPDVPEAMAGVHSENVLLVCDEASGIPEKVYEAGAGSMSGHNATTLLAGNPVRTSGLFFDTHHTLAGKWLTFHVSCVGHSRISPDFVEDMKARYGEDSNAFRVRVLGEFPKGDDDTVIPLELVEAALKRDVEGFTHSDEVWGLDVARFGSDRSSLSRRRGNAQVGPTVWWQGLDTMQTVGRVKSLWDETPNAKRPAEICVDAIGLGAGVADRLRELGLPSRAVNVSELPALGERFRNQRAELWWRCRDWLAARDTRLEDKALGAELVAVRFKYTSNGKVQVESKDDMKKRGVRSPDLADSFVLTFAAAAATALHGRSASSWKKPLKRNLGGIV